MISNKLIKFFLASSAALFAVSALQASMIVIASGSDMHLAEFEPEATYKAHYKKDGFLHPPSSKFIGDQTFTVKDSFFIPPINLPEMASLVSLFLDLTPVTTSRLSIQKPKEAPAGGTFASSREITNIQISIGSFVQNYSSPGLIDLLAAGLKTSDLEHPVKIGWTTTVTFTGDPSPRGSGNAQYYYLLQNSGTSLLSATMSGEYNGRASQPDVPVGVPESPTIALFGIGFLGAALCRKRLTRNLAI
jgi:hypothetical protein